MKRIFFFLFLMCLSGAIFAQQLSYRFANPRIIRISGFDHLQFDVQVLCDIPDTYLWGATIKLKFNDATFNNTFTTWKVDKVGDFNGTSVSTGAFKYDVNRNITGISPNLVYSIGVSGTPEGLLLGGSTDEFVKMPVVWTTLVTVSARLLVTTGDAMAGIDFLEGDLGMDGWQYYITAPKTTIKYTNPNLYDSRDFLNDYTGRFFSTLYGWSQIGATNVVDWNVDISTTVWEDASITQPDIMPALVKNLAITNGSLINPTLTVPANKWLTVSGTVTNDGSLVVNSDGSLINSSSAVAGATVERYLTGKIAATQPWHLISSPVGGQNIKTFVTNPLNSIATSGAKYGLAPYDNTIPGWMYYNSTPADPYNVDVVTTLDAGKGYEVLRNGDGPVSFAGTIPTGDVAIAVTNVAFGKWWNLIGNPYPSALYASDLETVPNTFLKTNAAILDNAHVAIYVWNPATALYETINYTSGETYIAPGQAFFIRTLGGTASFTQAMRAHKAIAFKSGQNPAPNINIKATIAGINRTARIYYIPGTTLGIDEGYDAGIFEENNPIILSTHIQNSEIDFAIQSLPDNDYENMVVPVGLNAPQGSNVRFTMDVTNLPGDTRVYLEDRLTGSFTRMDQGGSFYAIDLSSASKGTGRFYLHTKQGSMGISDQPLANLKVISLPQDQIIRILGPMEPATRATLFDMNGKVLVSTTLYNPSENEINFMPLSSGIYMLKLQTGTTIQAEKINWVY